MLGDIPVFSRYRGPISPDVRLVVVQPTPFCNINCDYCYLPDRKSTARLAKATFRKLLENLFGDGFGRRGLSIVWHAGEPMVLPPSYYESLFEVIDELSLSPELISHAFQTNGTLISPDWCSFFRDFKIRLGVSLDGPAWLHDRHRRDREGRGTHSRVLEGISCLRESQIDFHVIAVISSDSLGAADEIIDHFLELGIQRIGFNIEELEGVHVSSSLRDGKLEDRLRMFWQQLYHRQLAANGSLEIREFSDAYQKITYAREDLTAEQSMRVTSQVSPLAIVAMDWRGNLSSFSPELLGLKSLKYGEFTFGNVHEISIREMLNDPRFSRVAKDIYSGVRLCAKTCQYFPVCGGGAPVNKYFENGSFVSAETLYCRGSLQMPFDVALAHLESVYIRPPK